MTATATTTTTTTTTKTRVFLNISEIASFIGQNVYDFVTPFERVFKKYDKTVWKMFENQTRNQVSKYKILLEKLQEEKMLLEKIKQVISPEEYTLKSKQLVHDNDLISDAMSQKNSLVQSESELIQEALGEDTIKTISSCDISTETKRELVNKDISELMVSDSKKSELKKQTESVINKTHGTLQEQSAIEMFEKQNNVKLDTSQAYNYFEFKQTDNFVWCIGGKMDGIYKGEPEPFVVEVKNRTRSFFNSLRDYEKTQIQLYMVTANVGKAKLVERFKNKIRTTDIYRDDDYIDRIEKRLEIFVRNMDLFIKKCAESEKQDYFNGTNDQKILFIRKLYLNEINTLENKQLSEMQECLIDDNDLD